MIKQTTWLRPILASFCVLILGVAACNTPTEYEVQMGERLTLTVEDPDKAADLNDLFAQMQLMVAFAENWPGTEGVSMNVNNVEGGPVTADLMVWGQNVDGDALAAALQSEFPVLDGAQFEIEPLEGTAEGNLGDAMGHAIFDLEVEGETAEEIREAILQQIAEQGFTGEAVVDVQEADGIQTINIELNEVSEENGAVDKSGDNIVIERKDF